MFERVFTVLSHVCCVGRFHSRRVSLVTIITSLRDFYSDMDSKDTTSAYFPLAQEGTEGHQMWPIDDDDCIIIGEETLCFNMRNALGYSEDMFASQDPDLSASGPDDLQECMSETQDLHFNAIGLKDAPQDISQTPEPFSDEDDGPQTSNKMEDHPTPPELHWSKYDELSSCSSDEDDGPETSNQTLSFNMRNALGYEKTLCFNMRNALGYSEDMFASQDPDLGASGPAELEAEDNTIYEDMPQLEDSVINQSFTSTSSTDEVSVAENSENPLNSTNSTTNDSSQVIHELSKQEALSDTSEDVPIIDSDEESEYELHYSNIGGKINGSQPIKELTLKDYTMVYGKEFISENKEYVTKFVTELNNRKKKFEKSREEQEKSGVHVSTFTSLNQNSEKNIEKEQ